MRNWLILIFLTSCLTVQGQIEEIRRITEQLCSPEFHGRGYVNKGDSIAADFIVSEFKKLGLEPYKGDYLQPFKIKGVNTFPGQMSVSYNGSELRPGVDYVVNPSSQGYQGTLNPVMIQGSDLFDLDKIGQIVSDIYKGNVDQNAIAINYTGLSKDSLNEVSSVGIDLAQMVPVIFISDSKFTWSVGRNRLSSLLLHVQDSSYQGGLLTVDIESEFFVSYDSQNVMAYLPGKKKCKKTILFTAHYDHLGRMGSETYFPGGNDNASGTAMLLTMAKYFKENPSDYNILFVAFAGEEAGLLGSEYFVNNTPIKLKKIRFLLNLDIMGSGEEGITAVNATLFPEEFELLDSINTELNLLTKVKKRGPTANSDHYWFTQNGVPAFFIYTMGPNKNYHDVFDTYENLSFNEYEDITKLLVTFVSRLE